MDEATASGTVEASVQKLIIVKYRYDSDAQGTYRMALGQVVSIEKGSGGEVEKYKVHWLCRSERSSPRVEPSPKRPLVITTTVWSGHAAECRLSRSRRRGRGRGRGRPPWRTAAVGAAASVRGATRSLHGGGGDGCVEERLPSARDSKRTTRDATADGPCPPARAVRRAALTQGRGAPVGEPVVAKTRLCTAPSRDDSTRK